MKTTLPERSILIKPLLDRITSEILTAGKNTMLYALYRFGYHSKAIQFRDLELLPQLY